MAKSTYDENELRATRARLDVKDEKDAKFMMRVLGGEVGDVRNEKPDASQGRDGWNRTYEKTAPQRRIETIEFSEKESDPHAHAYMPRFIPKTLTRQERVKMDVQEATTDFKIKTWLQMLHSKFTFFSNPPDAVNKVFIVIKMDEFFLQLNKLVNKVRLIFPRNNTGRSKRFKQDYPLSFSILDTIRYWNVEKISSSLARLQSHPRGVVVSDFTEIVKEFYRPLVIMEMLSKKRIIKAVNDLNIMLENESDNQITPRMPDEIGSLFNNISEDIGWQLYPFLLKFTSDTFIPFDSFFNECEEAIRGFLGIDSDRIIQPDGNKVSPVPSVAKNKELATGETDLDDDSMLSMGVADPPENPVEQVSLNSKPLAVQRGLDVLEQLFPEAGWEKLDTFPDIYHYFAKSLSLKKNADIIDPENPMLQVLVLMQILDELFYGFRSISFNGTGFDLAEFLGIIDEWHTLIVTCFERTYIPRLTEFVKLFYSPLEPRQKSYVIKLREELNWNARLFLLPSLKIDSFLQSTIHKNDITAIFPKVRILRQSFTVIAGEIETALRDGGASAQAQCATINNPWDQYVFQVANPLSKRLNMLLGKENRTNVSLIYYTLSVLTVLDYLINNPNSWAYRTNRAKLFRSSDISGLIPESLPEKFIDADALFKQSIEKLKVQHAPKQ
jgi:hypothetical protein